MFLLGNKDKLPSIIKDPFKSDKITGISFHSSGWDCVTGWRATVKFRNGNTKGEQEFTTDDPSKFAHIVQQVEDFIKSLS